MRKTRLTIEHEHPLVEIEVIELHDRDELDELQRGEHEVGVLGVVGAHVVGLLAEDLDEQREQHGPDVLEERVQRLGGEPEDQYPHAEEHLLSYGGSFEIGVTRMRSGGGEVSEFLMTSEVFSSKRLSLFS